MILQNKFYLHKQITDEHIPMDHTTGSEEIEQRHELSNWENVTHKESYAYLDMC